MPVLDALLLLAATMWTSGVYQYDGAGNIRAVGADTYIYDSAGRLLRGSADRQRTGADNVQSYAYDSFGNIVAIQTTGANCTGNVACGATVTVSRATNHITSDGATYGDAGNLESIGGTYHYVFDPAGMLSSQSGDGPLAHQHIYTATDERIATRTGASWQWTLRDDGNRVVRILGSRDPSGTGTPGTAEWTWIEDDVFAAGRLVASVGPYGRRHAHLDHLGSLRMVTDDYGRRVADHAYYPFGAELNLGVQEAPPQRLKFAEHERDLVNDAHALDAVHARYYPAVFARFLSVDPGQPDAHTPQSWNRYVYAGNRPVQLVDPDGRDPIDPVLLQFFRAAFGENFSDVDVHSKVPLLGVGMTQGDVFLDTKHWDKRDAYGIADLAHELDHVLEQRDIGVGAFNSKYYWDMRDNHAKGMDWTTSYERTPSEQRARVVGNHVEAFLKDPKNKDIALALQNGKTLTKQQLDRVRNELAPVLREQDATTQILCRPTGQAGSEPDCYSVLVTPVPVH